MYRPIHIGPRALTGPHRVRRPERRALSISVQYDTYAAMLLRSGITVDEAIAAIERMLAAGDALLATDPLSDEEGYRGLRAYKEIPHDVSELRRRTAEWVTDVEKSAEALFEASPVSWVFLTTPSGVYPRTAKLRQILDELRTMKPVHSKREPLTLDGLHPKITVRCGPAFRAGQYDDAIFNAFKAVEHEVRLRITAGSEEIGTGLISKAMSPKTALLIFSGVNAEQEAVHSLFRGAIGVFKNPLSHRFLDISDERRAFETLTFASLLLRMLDEAKDQTP